MGRYLATGYQCLLCMLPPQSMPHVLVAQKKLSWRHQLQIYSPDHHNTLPFFFFPFKSKEKKKESLVSVISPLQTKTQVLHLPVPLFSLLLFPLGSKYPICSFLIIHSSTKRFCLVFIPRCDIFFMLEMFGMPLKVAKSFCGGPACKKKGVFWFVCLFFSVD